MAVSVPVKVRVDLVVPEASKAATPRLGQAADLEAVEVAEPRISTVGLELRGQVAEFE